MRTAITRLTVRGYELDSFGHVNNAVYLHYSETAIWQFFRNSQLMDATLGAGLFPVVIESSQRYLRELKLFDEVRIESEFSCTGGKVEYQHRIINDATDLVSCKVRGKIVFVSHDRIIHDIPDQVTAYLKGDTDEA